MTHYTTLVQRCRSTNSLLADDIAAEFRRIERSHDDNMERLKACEHIADGDEGWENLAQLCPSTAAVARLREAAESAMSWLDNWAAHVGRCPDGQVCTCGLDAIRNELRVALQPLT